MSGRIRTIKPELLEDEKTASLSHEAWRLFVSLLLVADDHGNFRATPRLLHAQIFWAREAREEVASLLGSLASVSLVSLYTAGGQEYGSILGWTKHQRVDKPSKPRVPPPSVSKHERFQCDGENPREGVANVSRESRDGPRPPTTDPDLIKGTPAHSSNGRSLTHAAHGDLAAPKKKNPGSRKAGTNPRARGTNPRAKRKQKREQARQAQLDKLDPKARIADAHTPEALAAAEVARAEMRHKLRIT